LESIFIALAFAQPPNFHQFVWRGQYLNGSLVMQTMSVKAYMNNTLITEVNSSNGNYGYLDLLLVEGGGE